MDFNEAQTTLSKGWCTIQGTTTDGRKINTTGTSNQNLIPENMRSKGDQNQGTQGQGQSSQNQSGQNQGSQQVTFFDQQENKYRSLLAENIESITFDQKAA